MGRKTNVSKVAASSPSFHVLKNAYWDAKCMQSFYPSIDEPEANSDKRRAEIQLQLQQLIAKSIIATRGINHGGNLVLNMCASNATVVKDPSENKKFEKRNQRGRIDGIVGLTMAIGAAMKQEDDSAEHSVYEERGFIEI
ncbi:terminase TerL endonuclease subunit [Cerasicoccus maritimus]|uniref:terminase TerL endonuclease subunit n=1 Tax=Cerasicoccus maritimus TaxID=490089 RepID=UPI0028525985|nr:terminase TerL endonuclease subunit [Cerasicoccus maritimus]